MATRPVHKPEKSGISTRGGKPVAGSELSVRTQKSETLATQEDAVQAATAITKGGKSVYVEKSSTGDYTILVEAKGTLAGSITSSVTVGGSVKIQTSVISHQEPLADVELCDAEDAAFFNSFLPKS